MKKAQIICTIGPASNHPSTLKRLIQNGMEVARLNLSHGDFAWHQQCIDLIKRLNKKSKRRVKILLDLEGHRIRVGELKKISGIVLKKNEIISLSNRAKKSGKLIPFDYDGRLQDIKPGSHVFIDDGNICLLVKKSSQSSILAQVLIPGVVREHKGVNIPDINLKFQGLTVKDRLDIDFGIENGVDFIAQSFVRSSEDVLLVRQELKNKRASCKIIAKIENRQGLKNIDSIIDVSDGIMVARGDMGVSLPIYMVPMFQKIIITKCKRKRKFAITATQMLESMTEHFRPTRAEVSDVANAVLDGSDFLMLSAETASGKYPVESVKMMRDTIEFTQKSRRLLKSLLP
ncbi:MAG: pyruvate kinase [Candidatus Omnitrophica bacterium]|nr:pyruvate kinase [Candidatus Omnitrophota bacterium]MDD5653528.1 pyruvate kinase [Candidatus Omnitrophota bacterium]